MPHLFLAHTLNKRRGVLPPSDRMTVRGGGFLLNASNETSINKLSPCAPRFNNVRLLFSRKSLRLAHDVDCRVHVPIVPDPAIWAHPVAYTQVFRDARPVPTV